MNEQLACWLKTASRWEADAPKAGNVHPAASFVDLTHDDFVRSAEILGDCYLNLEQPAEKLCPSIPLLKVARETRQQVGRNTNLGLLLLNTPLAAVPSEQLLSDGIEDVISAMDIDATVRLYEAIQLMQPGGMDKVDEQDLSDVPSLPVREVMLLAAERDLIAKQYVTGFRDVLGFGVERAEYWWEQTGQHRRQAVVGLHLDWMSRFPDTLIARKLGLEMAESAAVKARDVLAAGWPNAAAGQDAFAKFDVWLRADGNKRNPGTSADMTAASLFAAFRDKRVNFSD
ncbi:MAG: triphosphoribosyl-dephospho-CoA synthase [Rubinisphaera brasiliensis]|uniref:triphosphoribosyl-dephospho-CoA synthase n=1 Tax=Rubinisphaera brasiliensis TaxID=119 RepID=UPI00391DF465